MAERVSELVQLKLNIESSVGDSTPTEAEPGVPLPLVEVGVSRLDKIFFSVGISSVILELRNWCYYLTEIGCLEPEKRLSTVSNIC